MLGRGVPPETPGPDDPSATALDRAAPLQPWLIRVVQGEELASRGLRTARQGGCRLAP
jgi:hypothetical protein